MTETKPRTLMSRSGFCAFPSTTEHAGCPNAGCACNCHRKDTW